MSLRSLIEKLIAAIYKRPAIWDPRHENNKNAHVIHRLWDEIVAEVGCDCETLKRKWKGLRDYHRVELKKQKKLPKGSTYNSPWIYYNSLTFLNDFITTRHRPLLLLNKGNETKKSPSHTEASDIDTEMSEEDGEDVHKPIEDKYITISHRDEAQLANDSEHSYFSKTSEKKRAHKKTASENYPEKVSEFGSGRSTPYLKETEVMDEDLMFFQSLLPDLKSLPRCNRMLIKLKYQEMLYNEIFTLENLTPTLAQDSTRSFSLLESVPSSPPE